MFCGNASCLCVTLTGGLIPTLGITPTPSHSRGLVQGQRCGLICQTQVSSCWRVGGGGKGIRKARRLGDGQTPLPPSSEPSSHSPQGRQHGFTATLCPRDTPGSCPRLLRVLTPHLCYRPTVPPAPFPACASVAPSTLQQTRHQGTCMGQGACSGKAPGPVGQSHDLMGYLCHLSWPCPCPAQLGVSRTQVCRSGWCLVQVWVMGQALGLKPLPGLAKRIRWGRSTGHCSACSVLYIGMAWCRAAASRGPAPTPDPARHPQPHACSHIDS